MAHLSRKERERAAHRRQILEAAEAVFAREGFHEAGVQEIAERAEFSVGYLYNLFENKTDLYVELIDMRAAEFIDDVERRLDREQDVLDKVRTAIAAKVEFFKGHQRFFLIMARLHAGGRTAGPAAIPEKPGRRYRNYLRRLEGIFAEGVRRGLFVDVDPKVLVQCMEGMTNSAIGRWVVSGGKEGAVAEPEVLHRILFRGILAEGDQ
ncbi:MAG: TetR/AcrR family transcriptional regulator [Planctomycetota bacterium]|jgi:AcrR family transcriptional regulator